VTGRLYMLDARHRVERELLLEWLAGAVASRTVGPSDYVSLPPRARSGAGELEALAARLAVDETTELVPLRVAWRFAHFARDRAIRLRDLAFGDPRTPGPIRARMILRRDRSRATCLLGAPATLRDLRRRFARQSPGADPGSGPDFAAFVVRQAALALDREERDVQGGRYKTPRFVAEDIERQGGFDDELGRLARSSGRDAAALRGEARKVLCEMVSTPSALFLDLRHAIDRHLWLRGYDLDVRYDPGEFERLRATVRAHPTVVLFTHKTYGDAALPGMMFYANDLPMLHTFGGINLDLPGFGAIMRRSGGIFIRRSFRDDELYRLVMRRYVTYLLGARFPLSWALEGTRSRLGKLMPPKFGLLRYTLDAVRDARLGELHVVPFVTSFELIRDVDEYVAEQRGRPKQPESLRWLLRYARGRRRRMGSVRVDLGEDVVVRRPPEQDDRLALSRIAFDAAVEANRATPLTVTGVMCALLLGMAPRGATADELATFVGYLADWARHRGIRLSDELASGAHSQFFATLGSLVDAGLLVRCDDGRDAIYAIDPPRHPVASYYRNTIAHHFLDKAMLELAVAGALERVGEAGEDAVWAETDRLRELFKFEFFYASRDRFRQNLVDELDRSDHDWRARLQSGEQGLRRLARHLQPFLAPAVFLPYVEAYSVVMALLAQLQPGERLDQERCVNLALREGRRAYLLRRISSEASIGRILFENGHRLATHLGLLDAGSDVVGGRQALLLELRALGRRIERLRLEGVAYAEQVMAKQVQQ
jgi:glycerol-3-phosphate O-acyltransferase